MLLRLTQVCWQFALVLACVGHVTLRTSHDTSHFAVAVEGIFGDGCRRRRNEEARMSSVARYTDSINHIYATVTGLFMGSFSHCRMCNVWRDYTWASIPAISDAASSPSLADPNPSFMGVAKGDAGVLGPPILQSQFFLPRMKWRTVVYAVYCTQYAFYAHQRWSPRGHDLNLEDPRGQLTMSLVLALDCQSLSLAWNCQCLPWPRTISPWPCPWKLSLTLALSM